MLGSSEAWNRDYAPAPRFKHAAEAARRRKSLFDARLCDRDQDGPQQQVDVVENVPAASAPPRKDPVRHGSEGLRQLRTGARGHGSRSLAGEIKCLCHGEHVETT